MNPGKLFEQDFANSVPKEAYAYRLKDCPGWVSTCTCASGASPRFMPSNDYDYAVYWGRNFWALELKSVKGVSIRHDSLRDNQLIGLEYASEVDGVLAGILVEFRKENISDGNQREAWLIPIENWVSHAESSGKKSMNVKEARELGWEMPGWKKISRWSWDVEHLLMMSVAPPL